MHQTIADFVQDYFERVGGILGTIDLAQFDAIASELESARQRRATVFFVGNGGSASTASHFAADLGVGSAKVDPPFRALALADNNAVVTAIGNDYGFDEIFTRQLRILARPGDVLVAISASGNSPNLLDAVGFAKTVPLTTIALTAFDGGRLRSATDICVHVPTELGDYGRAEDIHLMINHALSSFLRQDRR